MIYSQFVGIVIKRTQTKKDAKTITAVTAEFPDQVNPEYQYSKERLTFVDNEQKLNLGDQVRFVVMSVPDVTEGEVINQTEYLEPEGS